jgi:tRNA (guanine-N7-)-methyltransferase
VQPEFARLAATRLAPGGRLHVATDWQEYAEQILEVLSAVPGLTNTAEGFAPRPAWRPETKFEQRGRRLGHGVWDVLFTKESSE